MGIVHSFHVVSFRAVKIVVQNYIEKCIGLVESVRGIYVLF
jgi:hypothetical protein